MIRHIFHSQLQKHSILSGLLCGLALLFRPWNRQRGRLHFS